MFDHQVVPGSQNRVHCLGQDKDHRILVDAAAFVVVVRDAVHHCILGGNIFVIDIMDVVNFIGQIPGRDVRAFQIPNRYCRVKLDMAVFIAIKFKSMII